MKKAENLKPGDSITVDGVRFVVKDNVPLLNGQVGIIFEDIPATEKNIAAFRKLQQDTAGIGILPPVDQGYEGWRKRNPYARAMMTKVCREVSDSLKEELKEAAVMDGRPWMEAAVEWGGRLRPYMEPGWVYLYQMFTSTFVQFPDKATAEEFVTWAGQNIDHWAYDPVAVIDTNNPEVCKEWAGSMKPEENYKDSALHKKVNLEFGRLEQGASIPASMLRPPESEHKEAHEASSWWVRSPDPNYKKPEDEAPTEVVVVVEDGRVTEVYATSKSISVTVLDMDTTDADEMTSLEEQKKDLQARIDAGELHDIL